jgi:hypothetical protein
LRKLVIFKKMFLKIGLHNLILILIYLFTAIGLTPGIIDKHSTSPGHNKTRARHSFKDPLWMSWCALPIGVIDETLIKETDGGVWPSPATDNELWAIQR